MCLDSPELQGAELRVINDVLSEDVRGDVFLFPLLVPFILNEIISSFMLISNFLGLKILIIPVQVNVERIRFK